MSVFEAIFLGVIQGLTEFIPVSSSGHLILAHNWLGVSETGMAFDIALHIGTLGALLVYFAKDISRLLRGSLVPGQDRRLVGLLALATLPAVVAGILLEDLAQSSFRSVGLVAFNLIAVALLMLVAERIALRKTKLTEINTTQALIVGAAQALALIPGVSRSGSTITAGLFAGLNRVAATRFAFLLAIPITFGAILKVMFEPDSLTALQNDTSLFAVGVLASLVSGLFAINFLLKFLQKRSLAIFAYYRIALGMVVLLFLT